MSSGPYKPDLSRFFARMEDKAPGARLQGRVRALTGSVMRAFVPSATVGQVVEVHSEGRKAPLKAQVVGFQEDEVVLMPLGETSGVGPESTVVPTGKPLSLRCGPGLLGRVLDGLGDPIDEGPSLQGANFQDWAVDRPPPPALRRARVDEPFVTGVRVLDGLLSMGRGQRVGLFAGSGVGKSELLGQIARGSSADVVVICLVGERGREVRSFLEDSLGQGRRRAVVVCATSDSPSLIRRQAPFVATSIAEYFRAQGKDVLLLMDSVTRFARAQREVGLSAGEPPVRRGYPPSVFTAIPRLLERAGNDDRGSITAIYTVLVAGGDMEEPIADELRGALDGHIVLSRALAERTHWPAVDVARSLSRVMRQVVDEEHQEAASRVRRLLAVYEGHRDLVSMGAYEPGGNLDLDEAVEIMEEMEEFLCQRLDEHTSWEETLEALLELADV